MEVILIWLLTQLLTRLSERWKVSQTYIALWLSILLWALYYVATTYYAVQWQQVLEVVGWVYASSQVFYNLAKKRWIFDKIDSKKEGK
jgi:hypothetical protein